MNDEELSAIFELREENRSLSCQIRNDDSFFEYLTRIEDIPTYMKRQIEEHHAFTRKDYPEIIK